MGSHTSHHNGPSSSVGNTSASSVRAPEGLLSESVGLRQSVLCDHEDDQYYLFPILIVANELFKVLEFTIGYEDCGTGSMFIVLYIQQLNS